MGVDNLINYCNKLYSSADIKYRCIGCNNDCKGSCEKCLDSIHFGDNRRYNCINIMNYYVCKYSYKYLSEIGNIFYWNDFIDSRNKVNILSIGCGPCTDLMGIKKYIENKNLDVKLKYRGIDLNDNWKHIHKFIEKDLNGDDVKFIYDDVFNVFNKVESIKGYDILFLQYLISDMVKYNKNEDMNKFINNLINKIINNMTAGSLIIINDINHCKARNYYECILDEMTKKGIKYDCYRLHYDNSSRANHYDYGYEYDNNDLICNVPENIQMNYNPWMFCSSAQLIIRRKE